MPQQITRAQIIQHLQHAQQMGWLGLFVKAARRHRIRLSVLLAVASRETEMGQSRLLRAWRGDQGHGRGLMQIDDRWHRAFVMAHKDDDHEANIDYAALLLAKTLKHPYVKGDERKAICSYNCGPGNMKKALDGGRDLDAFTAHGDYSADVLRRADIIKALLPVED
jgi:soluble lytic murein transglycosylase-like protein